MHTHEEDTRARRRERNAEWERRYAETDRFWSHRVNPTFADVAGPLLSGAALEIGCGEGPDAIWLAERGWRVTGLDVSATAVARARAAAAERGLGEERVSFLAGDAAEALPAGPFDLVAATFLHSREPEFPRIAILRAAAERVDVGGRLLIISHAAVPPWVRDPPAHVPAMRTPAEELPLLGLDATAWDPEIVEVRPRATHDPDGHPALLDDGVLLLRRRG